MKVSCTDLAIGFAANMKTAWLLRRVGHKWLFVQTKKRAESFEDFALRTLDKIKRLNCKEDGSES